ncbi:MAG: patatin-like phospholipase family protein, partial [Pseudolabrys sp.]
TYRKKVQEQKQAALCLSGGGIRSAALSLGVLKVLASRGLLTQFHYLSTVSGGGYVGCSLSAGLESAQGEFPFESRTLEDETPSTQHLRDYSNYLFPHGAIDLLHNASIYVRGLIANFVLIMPFLLVAAAVTLFLNPNVGALNYANVPGLQKLNIFNFEFFAVTS